MSCPLLVSCPISAPIAETGGSLANLAHAGGSVSWMEVMLSECCSPNQVGELARFLVVLDNPQTAPSI